VANSHQSEGRRFEAASKVLSFLVAVPKRSDDDGDTEDNGRQLLRSLKAGGTITYLESV
jgi:hypothetical protein